METVPEVVLQPGIHTRSSDEGLQSGVSGQLSDLYGAVIRQADAVPEQDRDIAKEDPHEIMESPGHLEDIGTLLTGSSGDVKTRRFWDLFKRRQADK